MKMRLFLRKKLSLKLAILSIKLLKNITKTKNQKYDEQTENTEVRVKEPVNQNKNVYRHSCS